MATDGLSNRTTGGTRATPTAAHNHVPLVAYAMVLGSGVVWSFGAVNAKLARHADAWQYLVWRSIGVVVVMEILNRRRGDRGSIAVRAYRSGRVMVLANVALMVASVCFIYALKTTAAANVALLASITPLLAAVLARVFIAERITPVTVVAMAVAFVGLLIMVTAGGSSGGTSTLVGNISAMTSALGFAGYAVCIRSVPKGDWSPVLAGYGVMTVVLCGAITLAEGSTLLPPLHDIGLALAHGALFIVGGTIMFNTATRYVGAGPMAVFAQSETVFVPVWAFLFLNERPRPAILVGGGIILAAVVGKALVDASANSRAMAAPVQG